MIIRLYFPPTFVNFFLFYLMSYLVPVDMETWPWRAYIESDKSTAGFVPACQREKTHTRHLVQFDSNFGNTLILLKSDENAFKELHPPFLWMRVTLTFYY